MVPDEVHALALPERLSEKRFTVTADNYVHHGDSLRFTDGGVYIGRTLKIDSGIRVFDGKEFSANMFDVVH